MGQRGGWRNIENNRESQSPPPPYYASKGPQLQKRQQPDYDGGRFNLYSYRESRPAMRQEEPYTTSRDNRYQNRPEDKDEQNEFEDGSAKYLLEKARALKQRPFWSKDDQKESPASQRPISEGTGKKIYNWDTDTFEVVREDEVPASSGGAASTNTMMSSKTRSMLDKLKESTAALQDMNGGGESSPADDYYSARRPQQDNYSQPPLHPQPQQPRKKSRFLQRDLDSTSPQPPMHPSYSSQYGPQASAASRDSRVDHLSSAALLADDILGGGGMGGRQRQRSGDNYGDGYQRNYQQPMPDQRRYQMSGDDDYRSSDYGGSGSRRARGGGRRSPSPPPGRQMRGKADNDDEDIDAYIANLKKKTTGRDMYNVLSQIEGNGDMAPSPMEQKRYTGYNDGYGSRSGGGGTSSSRDDQDDGGWNSGRGRHQPSPPTAGSSRFGPGGGGSRFLRRKKVASTSPPPPPRTTLGRHRNATMRAAADSDNEGETS
jgi:hypothetical protein